MTDHAHGILNDGVQGGPGLVSTSPCQEGGTSQLLGEKSSSPWGPSPLTLCMSSPGVHLYLV